MHILITDSGVGGLSVCAYAERFVRTQGFKEPVRLTFANPAIINASKTLQICGNQNPSDTANPSNPYVEFLTTNSGTPNCTELRVDTVASQLKERSWVQGASPLGHRVGERCLDSRISIRDDPSTPFRPGSQPLLLPCGSGARHGPKFPATALTCLPSGAS